MCNPLERVEEGAQTLPLALLWGDPIRASQFNDDALARTLENFAEHGSSLLATIGWRMQVVHPTRTDLAHVDTTAHAPMGDRPSSSAGPTAPLRLTRGHSKDHRPEGYMEVGSGTYQRTRWDNDPDFPVPRGPFSAKPKRTRQEFGSLYGLLIKRSELTRSASWAHQISDFLISWICGFFRMV